jgi:Ca2+/Na+ antiporter
MKDQVVIPIKHKYKSQFAGSITLFVLLIFISMAFVSILPIVGIICFVGVLIYVLVIFKWYVSIKNVAVPIQWRFMRDGVYEDQTTFDSNNLTSIKIADSEEIVDINVTQISGRSKGSDGASYGGTLESLEIIFNNQNPLVNPLIIQLEPTQDSNKLVTQIKQLYSQFDSQFNTQSDTIQGSQITMEKDYLFTEPAGDILEIRVSTDKTSTLKILLSCLITTVVLCTMLQVFGLIIALLVSAFLIYNNKKQPWYKVLQFDKIHDTITINGIISTFHPTQVELDSRGFEDVIHEITLKNETSKLLIYKFTENKEREALSLLEQVAEYYQIPSNIRR